MNRYLYGNANPASNHDPDGHAGISLTDEERIRANIMEGPVQTAALALFLSVTATGLVAISESGVLLAEAAIAARAPVVASVPLIEIALATVTLFALSMTVVGDTFTARDRAAGSDTKPRPPDTDSGADTLKRLAEILALAGTKAVIDAIKGDTRQDNSCNQDQQNTQTGANDCDPQGALYRGGSAGQKSLTPRPGNDTDGYPLNGLSTYTAKARACVNNDKVQVLDPAKLATVDGLGLALDPADPTHVFLRGATKELHLEWAATRETGAEHRLTSSVRDAIVRRERC